MNIIVTGAASGIGCKLVTQLAERGHAVLATDVDLERLEQSAAEFNWPAARVAMIKHDVADADAWTAVMVQAAEKFDRLDVLVNVAGVLRVEPVPELKPQSVALQLDVNTKGVILGTRRRGGRNGSPAARTDHQRGLDGRPGPGAWHRGVHGQQVRRPRVLAGGGAGAGAAWRAGIGRLSRRRRHADGRLPARLRGGRADVFRLADSLGLRSGFVHRRPGRASTAGIDVAVGPRHAWPG